MKKILTKSICKRFLVSLTAILLFATQGFSQNDNITWGAKFRIGGRYDNVRMCVASPAGATGGMAADISLFTEFNLNDKTTAHIDIPIMRPLLFAFAFDMLQFEPTFNLRFKKDLKNTAALTYGSGIGISLHYGPDYTAEETLPNGENSFFAMGPIVSGYVGYVFKSQKRPNIEIGISPYLAPLFSINDNQNRNGIVIGGLFDTTIRF